MNSNSNQTWECKYGCKNTRVACWHLERLISPQTSSPQYENTHKYAGNKIDNLSSAKEKAGLRTLLKSSNLEPIEVDILVLRYQYDEEFNTISKELGLNNLETVTRLHNEALLKLRSKW